MLFNTRNLYGDQLLALDGDIGRVKDFFFDDWNWVIRYLVADVETWAPGRLVLLAPHAFGRINQLENTLSLKLSKQQIADSPALDPQRPVTRQDESAYYRHYGWPAYWEGPALWGLDALPLTLPSPRRGDPSGRGQLHHREEKHLQSTLAVLYYHIQTTDGTVGHVTGFMVDERDWAIRQVVVETGDWLSGREILIDPAAIERFSHQTSKVFARLTKADILRNEEFRLMHLKQDHAGAENLPTYGPFDQILR